MSIQKKKLAIPGAMAWSHHTLCNFSPRHRCLRPQRVQPAFVPCKRLPIRCAKRQRCSASGGRCRLRCLWWMNPLPQKVLLMSLKKDPAPRGAWEGGRTSRPAEDQLLGQPGPARAALRSQFSRIPLISSDSRSSGKDRCKSKML